MNLNDQVCTLDQARKLKQLGIDQRKGLFEWCVFMPDATGEKYFYAPVFFQENIEEQLHEWVASAFTVPELMIMLPRHWALWMDDDLYACGEHDDMDNFYMLGKTGAEATANELISILETQKVMPEYCNKMLSM